MVLLSYYDKASKCTYKRKKDGNFSLLKRICRAIPLLKCSLSTICYHSSFSISEENYVAIYPSKIYDQSFFNQILVWRLRCCFCFSAKFYSNLISWWNKKRQFLHLINVWKEWIVFFAKSTRYDFVRIVSYHQLGFKIMMLPENSSITTDI